MAVAISAILVALGVFAVQRTRTRLNAERATVELRGLVAGAQRLASVASSRVGTDRLVAGPTCPNAVPAVILPPPPTPGHLPTIAVISPTQVEVPAGLTPIVLPSGDAALQIDCEVFDFTTETNGQVNLTIPAAGTQFTLAPNGRIFGPTPTAHFQITGIANPAKPYGFRVLSSGVICSSAVPPVAPNNDLCDEDV